MQRIRISSIIFGIAVGGLWSCVFYIAPLFLFAHSDWMPFPTKIALTIPYVGWLVLGVLNCIVIIVKDLWLVDDRIVKLCNYFYSLFTLVTVVLVIIAPFIKMVQSMPQS